MSGIGTVHRGGPTATQAAGVAAVSEGGRPQPSLAQQAFTLGVHKPLGALSLLVILVIVLAAVFADLIAPYDPFHPISGAVMKPPSDRFLLGTDHLGRDMFSRIVYGSRISLVVGFGAVAFGVTLATVIGLASAFFGGKFDLLIQRYMDAQSAFPSIILALAILAALGPGLFNVILAIGLSDIPRANRVVRGAALSELERPYVDAARAMGARASAIMWRHIFPNVTAPIIIIAATDLGGAILAEASLSFLGLGVPPPNPSWGGMLSGPHRTYMLSAPWMAVFPGIAISLAVLGWSLLGDSLRDIWDPRLRGR